MPTHVQDNKVVSDGYRIEDVEKALNVDALQGFLDSKETDMSVLFTELVTKIETPDLVPVPEPVPVVEIKKQEVIITPTPKKRGRPAKSK